MHEGSNLTVVSRPTKNSTSISDCPEAFAKWYCLNGATCFSVKIRDSTLYNCWCPVGFHGLRCDYKYVERRYQHTSQGPAYSEQGANNRAHHDAIANARHKTKEFHLMIVYNIVVVLLIFLIVVLTMRSLKKRGHIIKTMARVNEENPSTQVAANNEQINQDSVSIEFGGLSIIKQEQSHQHHHLHDRSLVEQFHEQELVRQQQQQQQQQQRMLELRLQVAASAMAANQTHWLTPVFTTNHYHYQQQRHEPV